MITINTLAPVTRHPVALGFLGGVVLPIMLTEAFMRKGGDRLHLTKDKNDLDSIKQDLKLMEKRVHNVDDYNDLLIFNY